MKIGHKLKEMRVQKNLTLEELANRCELSKGFLSQLERDLSTPGLDTLDDILEALGSSLSDFFKEERNYKKTFTQEDYYINEKDGSTIHWIVPNAQKNAMEPILLTLKEGKSSQIQDPFNGEEFGYVLEGVITLYEGGETYHLKKGDTFYIQSNHRHYLKNENAEDAVVLWVSTPPNF